LKEIAVAMSRSKRLGLDELMIVNPGPRDGEAYLLGDDNMLYRVEGLAENDSPSRFFLGDDGTLYEVMGPGRTSGLRRYRG
jgi:hypothetical protein